MINAIKKEIQRQLQESEERLSHIKARGWVAPNEEQLIVHLKSLLSFIDSLEVKEVELEKEIKEYIDDEWSDEWSGDVGNWIRWRRGTSSMTVKDVKDIAKHFFEFGLKVAQKRE